jgi:hypothetical protein
MPGTLYPISNMEDHEETFVKFWQPIICKRNGDIDLDKLKQELHDYFIVIQEVTLVYAELTGGRISKPNADSNYVIQAVEDRFSL